ncbi:hypothetical protein C2845_PM18G05120 [Panicum miliaceum]|uniref:Alpha/beta hydrolase fold-3 domain-containing protein n=1 Tax=Panicum miliaceum TaxID=4540 RepID=A0A3L6PHD2_PANMI|nr:hypothetical protein C2845_PM18G05120 [Panicum miliaceum]
MAAKKPDPEIADDMRPFLVRYKDGRVVRLATSPFVPASEAPGDAGVATRDVVIDPSTGVSVRLFRGVQRGSDKKLPLVVYYHGGAFCSGSAFSKFFHRYASSLCARAGAVVVSVDYRLAPEHPIPAAYDDAWVALLWAASLSDPWLAEYADPKRLFLAGESAGGNIVHNLAARATASPDGLMISIEGIVLLQPFFWGTERQPSETNPDDGPLFVPEWVDTLWPFLTAGNAGNDDPRLNPPAEHVMSLDCRRALIAVASKDLVRDRGCQYATWLRLGERCHEVTLIESKGEDHGFHLNPRAGASAVKLMDRVVDFINRTGRPSMNTDVNSRRIMPKSRL